MYSPLVERKPRPDGTARHSACADGPPASGRHQQQAVHSVRALSDSRGDFMKWTAFADGFVDGTAGTATQTA